MVLPVALLSSSPHCHETDELGKPPRGRSRRGFAGVTGVRPEVGRSSAGSRPGVGRKSAEVRRDSSPTSRTDAEVGPVLVQCPVRSLRDQPFATLVGATSSAGRHTHRLGLDLALCKVACPRAALRRHRHQVSGAGSTRWIAFLGRACRRHRQLLSTRGNGVIRYLTGSSICPPVARVNPTRTGHSQTSWSRVRRVRPSSASDLTRGSNRRPPRRTTAQRRPTPDRRGAKAGRRRHARGRRPES